jgi:hypothetical protein
MILRFFIGCLLVLLNIDAQHAPNVKSSRKRSAGEGIVYLENDEQYFSVWNNTHVGVRDLIPNINIFGTVILSDLGTETTLDLNHEATYNTFYEVLNSTKTNQTYDHVRFPHVSQKLFSYIIANRDKAEKVMARVENMQNLEKVLPFPLLRWPAVYSLPCPLYPTGHRTEKGLIWAHYRIWRDFAHFDHDLIADYENHPLLNVSRMSFDKTYLIDAQGNYYKYGLPFHKMDRIVIFEDDVVHVIKELNSTLVEELTDMNNVDVLYLGWCEGRTARPVPLCLHAYALTRQGAEKFVKYLEPCGRAIDEQFVIMLKNNWMKYRRAHAFSYSGKMVREDFPCHGDKTYGMFRQCKYLYGSLNGH